MPATPHDLLRGLGTALAGVLLAALTLGSARAHNIFRWSRPIGAAARALHRFHSRFVPDYVTWLVAGAAVFGAAAVTLLR
jgi:hypothetical protein